MAVTRNLNHVQVSEIETTRVWIDVPGTVNWEPSIATDSEDIMADGGIYATGYSAPVGEGDLTWVDANLAVLATLNGGIVSSSGTGATAIERYEVPHQYVAVPFSISGWEPNIAKDKDPSAGLRTTAPIVTAGVASKSSGQDSTGEWTAPTKFLGKQGTPMLIYELLASDPVFTAGIMPVNLTAPV